MNPTIKENRANTYHRDGTVSYWDVYRQQWQRSSSVSDQVLASMNDAERARVQRHITGD